MEIEVINRKKILLYSSISHLMVDMSTIFIALNCIAGESNLLLYIMLYNLFAFTLQLPMGIIADKVKNTYAFVIISFFIIFIGTFVKGEILTIFFVGVGNAMFHIGCGKEVLERSEGFAKFVGIYVSTGAIGVFLAKFLINNSIDFIIYIRIIIIVLIISLYSIKNSFGYIEKSKSKYELNNFNIVFFVIFLLIAVGIRSLFSNFNFSLVFFQSVLVVIATFLGKAIGGILTDRYGIKRVIIFSLLISIFSFYFYENFYLLVIGIFTFNMSMPITLILISNILKKHKGFAFGLTTFMLFVGSINLYTNNFLFPNNLLFLLPLIQFVCIFVGTNGLRLK